MTKTQVYIGIGSNIDREENVRGSLQKLESCFGKLDISPVYESKAYGFEGDDFFNLVVGFITDLSIDEIETKLRDIEYQFGRKLKQKRYSSRTLDIDLLLYGDLICDKHELPRIDIIKYAFVLKPLSDLAPDLVHPVEGKSISSLWENFNSQEQQLQQVKLTNL